MPSDAINSLAIAAAFMAWFTACGPITVISTSFFSLMLFVMEPATDFGLLPAATFSFITSMSGLPFYSVGDPVYLVFGGIQPGGCLPDRVRGGHSAGHEFP